MMRHILLSFSSLYFLELRTFFNHFTFLLHLSSHPFPQTWFLSYQLLPLPHCTPSPPSSFSHPFSYLYSQIWFLNYPVWTLNLKMKKDSTKSWLKNKTRESRHLSDKTFIFKYVINSTTHTVRHTHRYTHIDIGTHIHIYTHIHISCLYIYTHTNSY